MRDAAKRVIAAEELLERLDQLFFRFALMHLPTDVGNELINVELRLLLFVDVAASHLSLEVPELLLDCFEVLLATDRLHDDVKLLGTKLPIAFLVE